MIIQGYGVRVLGYSILALNLSLGTATDWRPDSDFVIRPPLVGSCRSFEQPFPTPELTAYAFTNP